MPIVEAADRPVKDGTRLGPFEIVSRIGAGGMGEVWRARDTRLDRDVAIKILPAEFAADAKLKLRFDREAKAISHLSHPNICTVFDIGENYLVMELLDGESLADRLTHGPLPLVDVVRYGMQIAEGLAKAHREGIIHRDLKPANIILTKGGAKLLDFGLAKSIVATASLDGATVQKRLTEEGTVIGTFQYMAPEQLAGEEADTRTDIFALGALLYEMTTGNPAFEGKNRTSLVAAIVSGEPRSMRELQPMTPPALEHVVTKCLQKDRDDRWQSASDVAEELRWVSQAGSGSGVAAPITRRRKVREWSAWSLAAIAIALAGYAFWRNWTAPSNAVLRATISLPAGVTPDVVGQPIAISPDGKLIVFGADEGKTRRLWIRRVDRFDAHPLNGTDWGFSPFFSPDGAWIGFFGGGFLRKIAISGGAPLDVCRVRQYRGATWGRDGMIYFVPGSRDALWKVPEDGGKPVQVSRLDPSREENSHRWPQILPDGKHALVTTKTAQISSFDAARIAVLSLSDGSIRTVIDGGMYGRYIPTGHLVYAKANGLYAIKFDLKRLQTSGAPVLLVDDIDTGLTNGVAQWDVSATGTLVYLPRTATPDCGLLWIDRRGQKTFQSIGATCGGFPKVSPDGRTIAMSLSTANDDIGLWDSGRGVMTRLSFEPGNESYPVWSPDGLRVFYTSELPRGFRIMSKNADGTGASDELLRTENPVFPWSISPDGKVLAFTEVSPATGADIFFFSLFDRKRVAFLQTPFNEGMPVFSPDGGLLAYVSNESGQREVYLRSLSQGGSRSKVSVNGGDGPVVWSPDGRELFFVTSAGFEVSTIVSGPSISVSRPRVIISKEQLVSGTLKPDGTVFDVMPDGRFVTGYYSKRAGVGHVKVVTNWFDEVRSRTASGH